MARPVITFLSDYGLQDDFVGVCHGVIATFCPDARVIDLTHSVPRHDARAGALLLAGALPFTPAGVHVAVVDPDVGARRRAVALRLADGRLLVGPDNGLLWLAAERFGGVVEAVEISHSRFRLEPVSATFHGRDIFAPVGARLAAGAGLAEAGEPFDPAALVRIELPAPRREGDELVAEVIYVDRFGNLQLNVDHAMLTELGIKLGRTLTIQPGTGSRYSTIYARTFADGREGQLLVYEDAYRRLAVAVRHGSAADHLGMAVGHELRIGP